MLELYWGKIKAGFRNGDWHNLPNLLTLFRIFASPVILILFIVRAVKGLNGWDGSEWLLVKLFIIASFTDLFDGFTARHLIFGKETEIGRVLDPLADGLFSIVLIPISIMYPIICVLTIPMILRQAMLFYFMKKYGYHGKTEESIWSGKVKVWFVGGTIFFFILPKSFVFQYFGVGMAFCALALVFTVYSAKGYYAKFIGFQRSFRD